MKTSAVIFALALSVVPTLTTAAHIPSRDLDARGSSVQYGRDDTFYSRKLSQRDVDESMMLVRDFHERLARAVPDSTDESGALNLGKLASFVVHAASEIFSRDELESFILARSEDNEDESGAFSIGRAVSTIGKIFDLFGGHHSQSQPQPQPAPELPPQPLPPSVPPVPTPTPNLPAKRELDARDELHAILSRAVQSSSDESGAFDLVGLLKDGARTFKDIFLRDALGSSMLARSTRQSQVFTRDFGDVATRDLLATLVTRAYYEDLLGRDVSLNGLD
ncbi:hypothetical protein QCA50_015388 [Cerrena zonata]|uniref:Uncharacterized protein n=1 Tax=Cerrena zonata TaxID=2478898 RepID=A0AAW0FTT0_9APHY